MTPRHRFDDTGNAPFEDAARARRKVVFDWSINLGHVLTLLGVLSAILMTYQNLDKRVLVVEQAAAYQAKKDDLQDQTSREQKGEIRDALKDVHTSLDKLADRVDQLRNARK